MNEARKTVDLNGTFRFKIDAKGRVSLPSKFRKVLPEDLVVAVSLTSDYLMVFDSQESFNEWVDGVIADKYGEFRRSNRQHIMAKSFLKGAASDVQIDSAGRILLPADLREKVGITRDVAIVGNTGYFEVWDDERRSAAGQEFDPASLLD